MSTFISTSLLLLLVLAVAYILGRVVDYLMTRHDADRDTIARLTHERQQLTDRLRAHGIDPWPNHPTIDHPTIQE